MIGCVNAVGPALVFMDAHIEVTIGWLEPLIDPLAKNHKAATLPVVDGLDGGKNNFLVRGLKLNKLSLETLAYLYNPDPETYMVGGFDWNLICESLISLIELILENSRF